MDRVASQTGQVAQAIQVARMTRTVVLSGLRSGSFCGIVWMPTASRRGKRLALGGKCACRGRFFVRLDLYSRGKENAPGATGARGKASKRLTMGKYSIPCQRQFVNSLA